MRFAGFLSPIPWSFFFSTSSVGVAISVSTICCCLMCAHRTSVHMECESSILWIIIASAKLNFISSLPHRPCVPTYSHRRRHRRKCSNVSVWRKYAMPPSHVIGSFCQDAIVKRAGSQTKWNWLKCVSVCVWASGAEQSIWMAFVWYKIFSSNLDAYIVCESEQRAVSSEWVSVGVWRTQDKLSASIRSSCT